MHFLIKKKNKPTQSIYLQNCMSLFRYVYKITYFSIYMYIFHSVYNVTHTYSIYKKVCNNRHG
jgi:hypothetical protein